MSKRSLPAVLVLIALNGCVVYEPPPPAFAGPPGYPQPPAVYAPEAVIAPGPGIVVPTFAPPIVAGWYWANGFWWRSNGHAWVHRWRGGPGWHHH
jgi:hypothetical protein